MAGLGDFHQHGSRPSDMSGPWEGSYSGRPWREWEREEWPGGWGARARPGSSRSVPATPLGAQPDFYTAQGDQARLYKTFSTHPELSKDEEDGAGRRYVGVCAGLASLIVENLLSHPFVVLRRQCQVHHTSRRSQLFPWSLCVSAGRLQRRQGVAALWKGLGSVCVVRGMALAAEDLTCKLTPWPKDINHVTSVLSFCQHILLKSISIAVVTPFYSASLVETVQSDIASEKPGALDVFREGALRLLAWRAPRRGRLLPVWAIVAPTVSVHICKYLFSISIQALVARWLRSRRQGCLPEVLGGEGSGRSSPGISSRLDDDKMAASFVAFALSEVMFFPAETILHRLYLQGTRTIIDDLDSGVSVLPILTGYEGFFDCYSSTLSMEGRAGLWKGLGALVLQLTAHAALLRLTGWLAGKGAALLRPPSPPPPAPPTHPLSTSASHSSLYSQRYLFN